ncbi:TPA: hypothetical protein IUW21_002325 [Enterococcus faecalis]|nr:hypothetical protein [Enterococcus faecalis]HAP4494503.1 hypothetical protein [Enterococcus faecalis]HAP4503313.1 hypothetical protein [Enterococcus faecalis]HAP4911414.1 hypothetical protein [Enterococcus faecalis]
MIENNEVDLVAFGRLFIANPDLVIRMKSGQLINKTYNLNKL